MPSYDTPIVFVEDTQPLPPSITEVDTDIAAFVGYTAKATNAAPDDLRLKPTLVRSVRDFEEFFGDASPTGATVHVTQAAAALTVDRVDGPTSYHPLYFAVRMFFENGGQRCYVASVGARSTSSPDLASLTSGVDAIGLESEPTIIVVPEAVSLSRADYATLAAAIIAQCARRRDRFAVFDCYDGGNASVDVTAARNAFPSSADLRYAAVYYPNLRTSLAYPFAEATSFVAVGKSAPVTLASIATSNPPLHAIAVTALQTQRVTLPPSGAIAGVYAEMDRSRGVWKAPANIALKGVVEPAVPLTEQLAERFNIDTAGGKSINTIRVFAGRGTLVWGARTLAGNDNEWRYVPVRRFLTMIEQSIAQSTQWVTFEPNDANTWVRVRASIENYLTNKWQQGGLLGTTTKEAFFVKCGLGQTMTAQDILDGRLNVEIGVATVRPAEFIILRFMHKVPPP